LTKFVGVRVGVMVRVRVGLGLVGFTGNGAFEFSLATKQL